MEQAKKIWILVANSSQAELYSAFKARLFKENGEAGLQLLCHYQHPNSRKKDSDLVTDKAGDFGSGAFVDSLSAKVHEAETFAIEIAHHLETGRHGCEFQELILVAPAHFIGFLKKHMSEPLRKFISQTIEKDYTHLKERELAQSLLLHM